MNKELIKIIEQDGQHLVSARDLHEFLNVTERFQQWFNKRIKKYGFEENVDYSGCKIFHTLANQELQDYALTMDMAKELSMVQNNEKGKQARKYFICCEKKLKENKLIKEFNLPKTYKEALLQLVAAEEEKEKLITANKEKENKLLEQQPKMELYNQFIESDTTYTVNEIAKVLAIPGMGRNNLYKFLRYKNIIIDEGYETYQKYIDKGYVEHITRNYKGKDNKMFTEIACVFTAKGIEWLYKKLKKDGYATKKSMQIIAAELEKTKK